MNGVLIVILAFVLIYVAKHFLRKNEQKKSSIFRATDSIDDIYNAEKVLKQKEIDRLLDKVSEKGVESLSEQEKIILDNYSKK
jgi:membrane protein implicated in regulation of membrane protease activity